VPTTLAAGIAQLTRSSPATFEYMKKLLRLKRAADPRASRRGVAGLT